MSSLQFLPVGAMHRSAVKDPDVSRSSSFDSLEPHFSGSHVGSEQEATPFDEAAFRSAVKRANQVTDCRELLNTGSVRQRWKFMLANDPRADNGTYAGSLQEHLRGRRLQLTGESESLCLPSWRTDLLQGERGNVSPNSGSESGCSRASLEVMPGDTARVLPMADASALPMVHDDDGRSDDYEGLLFGGSKLKMPMPQRDPRSDGDDGLFRVGSCRMPMPPREPRPDRMSKTFPLHRRLGLAEYVPMQAEPRPGAEPSDSEAISAAGSALQAARRLK
eukprot:TRINITY_DN57946_c0_g1_i2.p1 TRINITY_DN57946_c0_g1~~TRINITY_DN57946_c0_g1_i2.p1  ORF type:complete len:277 (+),score=52.27 TRINITY_DN57946_c0_g1_i2:57-887(+)